MRTFVKFCWFLTILGCVLGEIVLFIGVVGMSDLPQKAVAGALGLSFAIVPYCFTKALAELTK